MTPTKAQACLEGKRACAFDFLWWYWPKSLTQMLGQVPVNSRISFLSIPTPFSPYETASPNLDWSNWRHRKKCTWILNPCLSSSVTGDTPVTVTLINHWLPSSVHTHYIHYHSGHTPIYFPFLYNIFLLLKPALFLSLLVNVLQCSCITESHSELSEHISMVRPSPNQRISKFFKSPRWYECSHTWEPLSYNSGSQTSIDIKSLGGLAESACWAEPCLR